MAETPGSSILTTNPIFLGFFFGFFLLKFLMYFEFSNQPCHQIVTAAAVAGGTATAMYLDAKYHIRKDLRGMMGMKRVFKLYKQAGQCTWPVPRHSLPANQF